MLRTLVVVAVVAFALPSLAGPFESSQKAVTKALKAAAKKIDAAPSCAQTQGANIREALRQAQSFKKSSPSKSFDDTKVYISGIALGGALSSCPNDLYPLLQAAQDGLSGMQAKLAAPVAPVYNSGDDDDEDVPAAPAALGVTADNVLVNPSFVDATGSAAILFSAVRPQASGLQGKKIAWSLLVKRKSQPWTKAKTFSIGDTKVTAPVQALGDVSISVRYATFASKGMAPGEYVAALVGNVKAQNVFRDEIPFVLPATGGDDDDDSYVPTPAVYAPPVAHGPKAMSDSAFAGFLGAVQNTTMDSNKQDMITAAARKSWFTAAQLGQLLDTFVMESNKIAAAQAVIPRLVDRENAYGLADKFMFNSNRAAFTTALSL